MLTALAGGAFALITIRGIHDLEALLWVGILALQCIPYLASLLTQVAVYLPQQPPVLEPADQDSASTKLLARKLKAAQSV